MAAMVILAQEDSVVQRAIPFGEARRQYNPE